MTLSEAAGPAASVQLDLLDPYDDAAVADVQEFDEIVRAVDEPTQPPTLLRPTMGYLRHGWDGEPPRVWLHRRDGRVVGKIGLEIPERENRHTASVGVTVHPELRRRGLGTALFHAAVERVREVDRRLLLADSQDAEGPVAFARGLGFTQGSVEVRRRQDLSELDRTGIARLHAEAEAMAQGYSLLRFDGPVPDDLLEAVAAMSAAINDAPTDDLDIEDEAFDAERIRTFERCTAAWGRRWYRLVARRDADGKLAGHTFVALDPEQPEWAYQY
ncbi:MAG TPA: GNAT family N-acetyltransferase, partial [Actinopolymorphaceae bacterium]